MTAIYLGPSLSRSCATTLDRTLVFKPPADRGAIVDAVSEGHRDLIIIDGYFQSRAAVWHKEILWALDQGCCVVGASSMGALRAAELESFGMIGVGEIFRAFAEGRLTDDDEVAVEHGPPELDYVACSTSMVDIRATLSLAMKLGQVNAKEERVLLGIAKKTFFGERSYAAILAAAPLSLSRKHKLKAWIDENAVEQKRLDALEAIAFFANNQESKIAPSSRTWEFEETVFWRDYYLRERNPLAKALLPSY